MVEHGPDLFGQGKQEFKSHPGREPLQGGELLLPLREDPPSEGRSPLLGLLKMWVALSVMTKKYCEEAARYILSAIHDI